LADNDNKITHLVEQALTGNKTSLEQLIDHFYADIFRMVYYRLPTRMDAEDLTQEVFMQMIKSLPNLKDARLLKPWLFRIALNRVRDFHRKKSILSFFGSTAEKDIDASVNTDSYSDPSKNIMDKEFRFQLRKFSENLSRWEQEVFTLRFLDQLEIKEIVRIVQKNENTVKTHLYRALKKFRGNRELYSLLLGE
jgi:RNA polymerase sigma-70 factor (ECF subfamily)